MTKLSNPTDQPVRFIYATGSNGRKNTVAYLYDDATQSIRYGISQCSEKDQFVKSVGRNASFGRLVATGGKQITYAAMGGSKYAQVAGFVSANIDAIAAENFKPRK